MNFREEQVLQNISVDLEASGFTSIVGPSGCGKSTLLRCIARLVQPTAGAIDFDRDIEPGKTAFVFQHPNLLPWRDVLQNISLPLELQENRNDSSTDHKVDEAFKLVGLLDQDKNKLPRMLSGGMQMRVSLARALVTNPQILLLDEPFAALDDILRQQLNEELLRLWNAEQWTAVFVTHNVAEAVFLSQRVLVMSKRPGQIAVSIDVPFDYPRQAGLRATPEFASLAGRVSELLAEAAS